MPPGKPPTRPPAAANSNSDADFRLNDVSEQMRLRMDELFDAGYAYTYLYPGLHKVIQAAGRIIRTRSDRGVVYLIDDRYARREVRKLLPKWWRLQLLPRSSGQSRCNPD